MTSQYSVDKPALFDRVGYRPMEHQKLFHNSKARFRCAVCGRRAGKSNMVARDREASLFLPRTLGWIVAPTYDLGAKEFKVMWDDLMVGLNLRSDKRVKGNFSIKGGNMYMEFPWGSRVEVRSAQYEDTLVGEGLNWAIMAEAAKLRPMVFDKAIRPALSDKRGGADFVTCLTGDTLLWTEDGIIELGALEYGEVGETYEYGKLVAGLHGPAEKASKTFNNGVHETIIVRTQLGNSIEGTVIHPVWSIREDGEAKWTKLNELSVGDYIGVRRGARLWAGLDSTLDYEPPKHGAVKPFDLPVEVDEDLAYLMGMILGDGYIDFDKLYRVIVATTDDETKEFLEGYGFKQVRDQHWQISSKYFTEFLRWYGFDKARGPQKQLPARLLQASEPVVCSFLSGLFDADGTIAKRDGRVTYITSSEKLAKQVQNVLLNIGVVSTWYTRETPPTNRVKVTSTKHTLELNKIDSKLFCELIGFRIKRKQERAVTKLTTGSYLADGVPYQGARIEALRQRYSKGKGAKGPNLSKGFDTLKNQEYVGYAKLRQFLDVLEPYAYEDADWQYLNSLVEENYKWVKVTELKSSEAHTYDLVVPSTHAFVSNGIISHNTPEGKNWLYRLWRRGRVNDKDYNPLYESWRFPSWVNTEVYPGGENDPEIIDMRESTLEEWFLQEIAAEFTAVVGKIFTEFDEDIHVRRHEFNPAWPNYIAFDWGFANPLAAMEFQVAPDDTIYVWREHYFAGKTLEWHIEELKDRVNPEGYRLDDAFGDAADPEAVEYVSQHLVHCQADPDSKQWLTSVRLMKRFLKPTQQSEADADDNGVPILKPRYYVDPDCVYHIEEMVGYKTKETVTGDEFKGAGVVAKGIPDHSVDAMRYALMHLFETGVQHHLDEVYPQWAKNDSGLYTKQRTIDTRGVAADSPVEQRSLVGAGGPRSKTFFSMGSLNF